MMVEWLINAEIVAERSVKPAFTTQDKKFPEYSQSLISCLLPVCYTFVNEKWQRPEEGEENLWQVQYTHLKNT